MKKQEQMGEEDITPHTEEKEVEEAENSEQLIDAEKDQLATELKEANEKHLRLYAEFDNYRKRVNKDKEELIKYGNERLLHELLPFIDHLEMALKHASSESSSGVVEGVEITLKGLRKTLEKFGLTVIEAEGKPFDPSIHHAISQVEREDVDENIVVEELRKGYMLKDKVLRASLVAVSKKPVQNQEKVKEADASKTFKNAKKFIEEES
jgi:molecular chaperone GrpE